MHVEFLLEEPSAEAALHQLLPRLLPPGDTWRCVPHRGKDALLLRLPSLLKTYASRIPHEPELRVVILMDADSDCRKVKKKLEDLVGAAHLLTKTTAGPNQPFRVLTRLAVAELEAWFLGDRQAIQTAYSRVRSHHFKGLNRDPDAIVDTWETLHKVLREGGYYVNKYLKIEVAERIAEQLSTDLARNTSASFRYFCEGLEALR
ncbi:DUF4276 family protein [Hymenobacter ruricola]|uniref:DUF4276 family protein n=1 Tax=Hymenobacter ruricola TaxID=2791023 RepID=A0ABS0I4W7_9BACT|nr:DUF4276 family protein [Hymenobacter ruricola]MBF9221945.1 DUF4276 family protein [Hymenobacter ruricola]